MKKLKRTLTTLTLSSVVLFGSGSMLHVRADQSVGPQGQQESKSKGPSTSSSQQDLDYLLWLIIMWLLGWL
jgi:hypothetical protein